MIENRDAEFHRWLGPGSESPEPTRCIVVDDEIVGWIDYDIDREWLQPGEVNVGYNIFAAHRGIGYGSRALQLLMNHLAVRSEYQIATLLIATDNERSLALAQRCGFSATDEFSNSRYFKRPVPPLSYSDGTVTIRRRRADDLEADLEAKDDEQIDWLWLSGQRESWEAMTIGEQRSHALSSLLESHARFATGPKWAFTVDTTDVAGVAYVDCDLHNDHVPPGEANIAYSAHPAHRGKGWVTSAVRLVVQFLSDHTAAREAHLLVDSENEASSRVARAVGATAREQWQDEDGRTVVRHVLSLDRRPVAGQRSPSSGAADVHGANDRW